jgi:Mannosyltransferase (PIG-V)
MARDLRTIPAAPVPLWVKLVDAIAGLMLLLFGSVAMFGGMRFDFAFGGLSLTSAPLVLILALGLLAVRHVVVRQPAIHQRLIASLRRLWHEDAARAAATTFVITRPMVLVVGFLAVVIIGYAPKEPVFRISNNEWLNLPLRWDAGYYCTIAAWGYKWEDPRLRDSVAFFPAYPVLMRVAGTLVGARPSSEQDGEGLERFYRRLLFAGLCVSFVAFFWACRYLFRLSRDQLDEQRARATLVLLASYPFAVFFSAAYTESLFLLATVAAFYHTHRDEPFAAGAWGLLAGLSRPNGFLLTAPLALFILQRRWPVLRWPLASRDDTPRQDGSWRRLGAGLAAALMPAIGLLVYSAYLYQLSGNPFAWVQAHRAWGRTYRGLTTVIVDHYHSVVANGFYGYLAGEPFDFVNAIGAVTAVALLWPTARRIGNAFALHVALLILPPMAAGGMLGMGRITSVAFPMFAALAAVLPARLVPAVVCAFALLQGLVATAFFTCRPLV